MNAGHRDPASRLRLEAEGRPNDLCEDVSTTTKLYSKTFRKRRGVGGQGADESTQTPSLESQGNLPPGKAARLPGGMNQSEDGDEVVGLLSPADTHQVIHVRGSAAPRPISHFPSKAKGPAAPTSVLEPRGDGGTSPRGFPSGSIPRPGGGRSPPPGAPRAPSPHAAPRLSSLRIAIASAELPAGIPSAKPGKAAGQFHSWPPVGRSAGPWRRRLDAAGQERPGERRGAAEASPGGRFPPSPEPRRAPSLPLRSAGGRAIPPLYMSLPGAGRREGAARAPRCFLGGVVLFTQSQQMQNSCGNGWGPHGTAVLPCTLPS